MIRIFNLTSTGFIVLRSKQEKSSSIIISNLVWDNVWRGHVLFCVNECLIYVEPGFIGYQYFLIMSESDR